VLDLVFDEAQRIAARVRGETRVATGRVSLAEIAVDHLRRHAATAPGTIAIVGVSPMTERAARSLAALGMPLVFVNRSAEKAQALARSYGAEHMPLTLFLANPQPLTALLTSTGADHAVLPDAALERLAARAQGTQGLLIVDMAVPPDAEPDSCKRFGIRRIGIDEIVAHAERNRAARLIESADAREQVDRALEGLHERIAEKYYGPLLGTLQKRYKRTAEEGIERLLKKELDGLGAEERAAIQTWCEVLARRFAHIPCMGLRGLMQSGPEGSIEAFLSGLEPEFADELRAALGAGEPPRGAAP
jgi:glutamyl-tRNA reductase